MSIAIDLSSIGSISTYSDLLFEIRDLQDNSEYDVSAISRALRKTEAYANRELRTPDMERRAPLDVVAGVAALPTDFLAIRKIFTGYAVPQISLNDRYRSCSYTVEGGEVRFADPMGTGAVALLYYAAIPPLGDNQATNWLLTKHADAYVSGILYHLNRREGDTTAADGYGQEFLSILEAIKQAGESARWGGGPLVPHLVTQVRGVRA